MHFLCPPHARTRESASVGRNRALENHNAIEVLGDPWEAFGPGTWTSSLRPIFRVLATRQLKRICTRAMAVHYVTSETLQNVIHHQRVLTLLGFPDVWKTQAGLRGAHPSQISAPPRVALERCKMRQPHSHRFYSAVLVRMYKGPDTLLHAAALCLGRLNLQLVMVGGAGRYLPEMKSLAA